MKITNIETGKSVTLRDKKINYIPNMCETNERMINFLIPTLDRTKCRVTDWNEIMIERRRGIKYIKCKEIQLL